MNRSTLRTAILILGLITANVHLVVLNSLMGKLDPLFTLNGLGYLALLGAFFLNPSIVAGRRRLLSYAFMAFTAVTILAWVFLGDMGDRLAWFTKADEVLLIIALAMNLRNEA
jgi:Na+/melibiose symporter-like transporter